MLLHLFFYTKSFESPAYFSWANQSVEEKD